MHRYGQRIKWNIKNENIIFILLYAWWTSFLSRIYKYIYPSYILSPDPDEVQNLIINGLLHLIEYPCSHPKLIIFHTQFTCATLVPID